MKLSIRKKIPEKVEAEYLKKSRGRQQREPVPIVVAVYQREDETKAMFEQLAGVTDNYSLIIVNNGFGDTKFLKKLKPEHYIENEENTGAIRPVNQGLEVAVGKYVAVLHNDLLIYDEGWLDQTIEFMERRPDVGLVGFAGRHSIRQDGSLDLETTMVSMRGYPKSLIPSWRFTEVATIDGLGWVMRNFGFRLEESFGHMHFYDLDLSLQYIDAGYNVYSAAVEIFHLAELKGHSTRETDEYLDEIGKDDEDYYEEVREMFRKKWEHLLPITRGHRDEVYHFYRINEMVENRERTEDFVKGLEKYTRNLEKIIEEKNFVIEDAAQYGRKLEKEIQRKQEEIDRATVYVKNLEQKLSEQTLRHRFANFMSRELQRRRNKSSP